MKKIAFPIVFFALAEGSAADGSTRRNENDAALATNSSGLLATRGEKE